MSESKPPGELCDEFPNLRVEAEAETKAEAETGGARGVAAVGAAAVGVAALYLDARNLEALDSLLSALALRGCRLGSVSALCPPAWPKRKHAHRCTFLHTHF